MRKLEVINYSVSELESLLKSNKDYTIGIRLLALIQIKKGLSSRELKPLFYKSHSRYCIWVKRFNDYGIKGLEDKPGRGRKSKLSEEQKNRIKQLIVEQSPSEHGFNSATWTGPLLIDWIQKEFGVTYKRSQIYNILKGLGLSFQKSRPSYAEADKKQQKEFKETLKKTSNLSK